MRCRIFNAGSLSAFWLIAFCVIALSFVGGGSVEAASYVGEGNRKVAFSGPVLAAASNQWSNGNTAGINLFNMDDGTWQGAGVAWSSFSGTKSVQVKLIVTLIVNSRGFPVWQVDCYSTAYDSATTPASVINSANYTAYAAPSSAGLLFWNADLSDVTTHVISSATGATTTVQSGAMGSFGFANDLVEGVSASATSPSATLPASTQPAIDKLESVLDGAEFYHHSTIVNWWNALKDADPGASVPSKLVATFYTPIKTALGPLTLFHMFDLTGAPVDGAPAGPGTWDDMLGSGLTKAWDWLVSISNDLNSTGILHWVDWAIMIFTLIYIFERTWGKWGIS
jgi:hypothetical protein